MCASKNPCLQFYETNRDKERVSFGKLNQISLQNLVKTLLIFHKMICKPKKFSTYGEPFTCYDHKLLQIDFFTNSNPEKEFLGLPCNYRPKSLLPLISKVIEKVIHDQTSTFLNSKNLLYTYQSGFQKKHSTDFCLSYLNDKILKGFDKGLMTGMILIDLQKAFDTIDHDVLLQKLYAIGFSKHTVNWFQSYLSNRSFLVNLGNNFSQPASVCCGVTQGSILGPLLFLIHVKDMSQAVK